MSYCHECGEKIAKDDVYCPFCGIALQTAMSAPLPVTTSEENDDSLSFEATQVDMPFPEQPPTPAPPPVETPSEPSVSTSPAAEKEEVVIKDISIPLMPEEFDSGAQAADSSFNSETSEQIPVNTEEIENIELLIPEDQPQKISEFPDTGAVEENLQTSTSAETAMEDRDEVDESGETSGEEIFVRSGEEAFSEQKDDANVSPALETVSAAEPPPVVEDRTDNADLPNHSTVPYTPEDFRQQELIAVKIYDTDQTVVKSAGGTESDAPDAQENQIKLPATPLPEVEEEDDSLAETLISAPLPPFGQINQANQVGALENSPSPIEPEAASEDSENIPGQVDIPPPAADSAPAENVAATSAENAPEGESGRSFTSPNVNSVDTGGKKAKLKTLSEGTVLNNRYEIVRKIGGGGMGAVYLASDRNLGGILRAVKEMVQSYIEETQQEKALSDFKRESLLLTSLEHTAIPTIFDYFYDEKEGRFYLVMKYISGGDLAGRLRSAPEGRIDEQSVTEWAIQIADVLDYLHNRQPPIVYRDLKPSNIMIDGNSGKVMLIDFGIARWVNKEEKGVTAVGTMGYAPPELFSGNVEPRSDIYSLGSTMFHLLTGADPQNNPLLIFDFNKHPRPRQINPQLSDQIELILMRAVEYSADKRFNSAGELRDTLLKHLENIKAGKLTFGLGDHAAAIDNQPVFCGFCGQKIVASDMFCPFCGAKQPLAGTGATGGAAAAAAANQKPAFIAPKQTAKLYVINTSDLEAPVFNLEKDTNLVGRRDPMSNIFPEIDLSKYDPQTKISRRHARIWREGETFMVEDLGSSNGTTLMLKTNENIRLLPQQPRSLTHGDKLKLGDTTLHFVLG